MNITLRVRVASVTIEGVGTLDDYGGPYLTLEAYEDENSEDVLLRVVEPPAPEKDLQLADLLVALDARGIYSKGDLESYDKQRAAEARAKATAK